MIIKIDSTKEKKLRMELAKKDDPESRRIKRFLDMPDLSRTNGNPISELADLIVNLPDFKDFDIVEAPEIVRADLSFDLFNFPPDHPARSKSDTYFLDDNHILRTHTTIMWYYHIANSKIKDQISKLEPVGALSYGKVYRKDEIDRNHMNVFHQMDGWYLVPRAQKVITIDDLKNVLIKIAHAVFGKGVRYRFNVDEFPYTDPSVEMEIERRGKWVEVLGSGVVRGVVLKNLGVDPEVYNGWAFGFGLERLAIVSMELPDIRLLWSDDPRVKKQLKLGHKFKEVSKYPKIIRDVSFVVKDDFVPNNYFDLVRDIGGDLVEEVELLDKFKNPEKFGADRTSYTYRIVYRSMDRTLTNEEVDKINSQIYQQTASQFGAELR